MRRREFITLIGAAVTWPVPARAQQGGKRYTIGILSAGGAGVQAALNSAFFDGLRELGWDEGKNVVFENRNAENRLERRCARSLRARARARETGIRCYVRAKPPGGRARDRSCGDKKRGAPVRLTTIARLDLRVIRIRPCGVPKGNPACKRSRTCTGDHPWAALAVCL